MANIQNLSSLTEEDIKFRYITPAIEQARIVTKIEELFAEIDKLTN